jgi:hypothetical protein
MMMKRSLVVLPATLALYVAMPPEAFAAVIETAAQQPDTYAYTDAVYAASETAGLSSGAMTEPLLYAVLILFVLLLASWALAIMSIVRYSRQQEKICHDYNCIKNPVMSELAGSCDFSAIETPREFLRYEAQMNTSWGETARITPQPAPEAYDASSLNLTSNFGYKTVVSDPFNNVTMDLTMDMVQKVLENLKQPLETAEILHTDVVSPAAKPAAPAPAPDLRQTPTPTPTRTEAQSQTARPAPRTAKTDAAPSSSPALKTRTLPSAAPVARTRAVLPVGPSTKTKAVLPLVPFAKAQAVTPSQSLAKPPIKAKLLAAKPKKLMPELSVLTQKPHNDYRGKHFKQGGTSGAHSKSHLQTVPTMKHARSNVDQAIERVIEQASRKIS